MTLNTRRRLLNSIDKARDMLKRAPEATLACIARDNAEDSLHELDRMPPEVAAELQPQCEQMLALDQASLARVPSETFEQVLSHPDATLLQQSAMAARLIASLLAEGVIP